MNTTTKLNLQILRIVITVVITIFIFSLLLWDNFHGGVPNHHLLDQKDLPAVSNWWGGILLPILTWILLGRIKSRVEKQTTTSNEQHTAGTTNIFIRAAIGLLFGIALAVSFVNNYKLFLDNVLYLLLILSFIIPIFFSEFILGFVLGMVYTFGAILPTAFILIMALIGFVTYKLSRLLVKWIKKKFGKKQDSNNENP